MSHSGCQNLPKFVISCQKLPLVDNICQKFLKVVISFHKLPKFPKVAVSFYKLPKITNICQKLPSFAKGRHKLLEISKTCQKYFIKKMVKNLFKNGAKFIRKWCFIFHWINQNHQIMTLLKFNQFYPFTFPYSVNTSNVKILYV